MKKKAGKYFFEIYKHIYIYQIQIGNEVLLK